MLVDRKERRSRWWAQAPNPRPEAESAPAQSTGFNQLKRDCCFGRVPGGLLLSAVGPPSFASTVDVAVAVSVGPGAVEI
jgi:hypothetical protein